MLKIHNPFLYGKFKRPGSKRFFYSDTFDALWQEHSESLRNTVGVKFNRYIFPNEWKERYDRYLDWLNENSD